MTKTFPRKRLTVTFRNTTSPVLHASDFQPQCDNPPSMRFSVYAVSNIFRNPSPDNTGVVLRRYRIASRAVCSNVKLGGLLLRADGATLRGTKWNHNSYC